MLSQARAEDLYGREDWDEDVCGGRNEVRTCVVGRGEVKVYVVGRMWNCCWWLCISQVHRYWDLK